MKNSDMVVNVNSVVEVVSKRVGRPATELVIPESGSFTLTKLSELNGGVKRVTVRAGLMRALRDGVVTRLATTVKTGGKGKPAYKYMNTEALRKLKEKNVDKVEERVSEVVEVA
jgi:predicted transcriptional regulator